MENLIGKFVMIHDEKVGKFGGTLEALNIVTGLWALKDANTSAYPERIFPRVIGRNVALVVELTKEMEDAWKA